MPAPNLLMIEVTATIEERARARALDEARRFGASRPQFIGFRRDQMVGLDADDQLVYAWRALMCDLPVAAPIPTDPSGPSLSA